MSGERSVYFVEMASRAARRLTERIAMVADRYGQPVDPTDDVITFAEMLAHVAEAGHHPGMDDTCTEPICEQARRMIAGALAALMQEQRVPQ